MTLNEIGAQLKTLLGIAEKSAVASTELADLRAALTTSEADLAAANKTISDLTAKLSEKEAALTAKAAEVDTAKASIETEVETRAAAKAAQIVASQGAPPLANQPTNTPGAPVGVLESYDAITDPKEKEAFRRKNWNALWSAVKAAK